MYSWITKYLSELHMSRKDIFRYMMFFITALTGLLFLYSRFVPYDLIGHNPNVIREASIYFLYGILLVFLYTIFTPGIITKKDGYLAYILHKFVLLLITGFLYLITFLWIAFVMSIEGKLYPNVLPGGDFINNIVAVFFPFIEVLPVILFAILWIKNRRTRKKISFAKNDLLFLIIAMIIYTIANNLILILWMLHNGYSLRGRYYPEVSLFYLPWWILNIVVIIIVLFAYERYFDKLPSKYGKIWISIPSLELLGKVTLLFGLIFLFFGLNVPGHIRGSYCYYFNLCPHCGEEMYQKWCIRNGKLYLTESLASQVYRTQIKLPEGAVAKKMIRPLFIKNRGSWRNNNIIIQDQHGNKYEVQAYFDFKTHKWNIIVLVGNTRLIPR